MSMNEGIPQMPRPKPEQSVANLKLNDPVIRNGESVTITGYRTIAGGEIQITFSNGDQALLEGDDTLEVPA